MASLPTTSSFNLTSPSLSFSSLSWWEGFLCSGVVNVYWSQDQFKMYLNVSTIQNRLKCKTWDYETIIIKHRGNASGYKNGQGFLDKAQKTRHFSKEMKIWQDYKKSPHLIHRFVKNSGGEDSLLFHLLGNPRQPSSFLHADVGFSAHLQYSSYTEIKLDNLIIVRVYINFVLLGPLLNTK